MQKPGESLRLVKDMMMDSFVDLQEVMEYAKGRIPLLLRGMLRSITCNRMIMFHNHDELQLPRLYVASKTCERKNHCPEGG